MSFAPDDIDNESDYDDDEEENLLGNLKSPVRGDDDEDDDEDEEDDDEDDEDDDDDEEEQRVPLPKPAVSTAVTADGASRSKSGKKRQLTMNQALVQSSQKEVSPSTTSVVSSKGYTGSDGKDLLAYHSRVFYKVPLAAIRRGYDNEFLLVESAERLVEMFAPNASIEKWPKAEEINRQLIWVVAGPDIGPDKQQLNWFIRCVVKGKENESVDRNVLRLVPKALVKKLIALWERLPTVNKPTRLISDWAATSSNDQCLNPKVLEWVAVKPTPFSFGAKPKESKESKESKERSTTGKRKAPLSDDTATATTTTTTTTDTTTTSAAPPAPPLAAPAPPAAAPPPAASAAAPAPAPAPPAPAPPAKKQKKTSGTEGEPTSLRDLGKGPCKTSTSAPAPATMNAAATAKPVKPAAPANKSLASASSASSASVEVSMNSKVPHTRVETFSGEVVSNSQFTVQFPEWARSYKATFEFHPI